MGVVQARCAGLDVHTRRRAFAQRDESGLLLAGATNPASQERQHRSPVTIPDTYASTTRRAKGSVALIVKYVMVTLLRFCRERRSMTTMRRTINVA
jgi:hypothetical protein